VVTLVQLTGAVQPAAALACVFRLHVVAVRLAARVSDGKRIRGVVCEMHCTNWHLNLLYLFTKSCVCCVAASQPVSNYWSDDKDIRDSYRCNTTMDLYNSDSGAAAPLMKLTVSDMILEAFQNTSTLEFNKPGLSLIVFPMVQTPWPYTNKHVRCVINICLHEYTRKVPFTDM